MNKSVAENTKSTDMTTILNDLDSLINRLNSIDDNITSVNIRFKGDDSEGKDSQEIVARTGDIGKMFDRIDELNIIINRISNEVDKINDVV